ncbi:MAG: iron-sulfur cluster-binding protein [Candidatus Parabeggiatoa sp. nov. 2]|nr:MAG: iron-sulfur cluster-binding protein [Beggiatoa sp. 4572_84]RKZ63652.1 MAG: iron-sulfur cluster-binding protein [Gammaproteobacteria bacterium]
MKSTAHAFKSQATKALKNASLQKALARTKSHFIDKRREAVKALPEFDTLRQCAREIKEDTLAHLDFYLEHFEKQVVASGGQLHWADTPQAACEHIVSICQTAKAQRVTKGKSMISEEIALNSALEKAGFEVIETDLGEYIIQLAKEPPSHIIAPAVHKTREQVADLFHQHHQKEGLTKRLTDIPGLVNEARQVLRAKFLSADVGITGANFLIAQTGSTVIVTNEGNGDLTNTLPRVHIVVASIEKVVPTLEDATTLLRLLARSATGQEITSYTTFSTGPRRQNDLDGPEAFHVVLVDNGRSEMLGNEFHDMLRCIRCGACLNHCPVYGAVGGHAYGWVYPGPMGAVLTPLMLGLKEARNLPNASTLCGRCEEVCPMQIPLPKLLRHHRVREYQTKLSPARGRWALKLWAFFAKRPRLYHRFAAMKIRFLGKLANRRGRFRYLPFAGGWTKARDMPAPQGETFMEAWKKQSKKN